MVNSTVLSLVACAFKGVGDEDKSPLQTVSPVTSLCPEANEGFNITVLIIIEF